MRAALWSPVLLGIINQATRMFIVNNSVQLLTYNGFYTAKYLNNLPTERTTDKLIFKQKAKIDLHNPLNHDISFLVKIISQFSKLTLH